MRKLITGLFLSAAALWGQCSLTTVSPSTIAQGTGSTLVSFTGAGLQPGAPQQLIFVAPGSGPTPVQATIVSTTQGNAVLPASAFATAGTLQIFLGPPCQSNPLNITVSTPQQMCPTLASLSPTSVPATVSGTVQIDLTGSNFQAGDQAVVTGQVISATPEQTTVTSQTQARVFLAAGLPAGAYLLSLSRSGCPGSNALGFTVVPQQQSCASANSVSPSSIPAGSIVMLTINGSNFNSGVQVTLSGPGLASTPLQATLVSSMQLTVTVTLLGSLTAGAYSISVTSPGGACSPSTLPLAVTQAQPSCPSPSSVSPSSVPASATSFAITVNGINFTAGMQIVIAGPGLPATALPTSVTGSTQATATAPANLPPGSYGISITGPGQCGASSALTLTIAPAQQACPTLSSVSPAAFPVTSGIVNVTLFGTNFLAGDTFSFGTGQQPPLSLAATIVSSTQATVALSNTPAGTYTIFLSRPGSQCPQASAQISVTRPQPNCPVFIGVLPSTVPVGSSAILQFIGQNLSPGDLLDLLTGPSGVPQNTLLPLNVLGPTQAFARVDASLLGVPGAYQFSVSRPNSPCDPALNRISLQVTGGQTSSCPVISAVSPTHLLQGTPNLTLTLTGLNFLAGDAVLAGGDSVGTMLDSSTMLRVTLTPPKVAGPGTVSISVTRPGCAATPPALVVIDPLSNGLGPPGSSGNRSAEFTFVITAPSAPGTYTSQWRLFRGDPPGCGFFGCQSEFTCGGGGVCTGPTCGGDVDQDCDSDRCSGGSCASGDDCSSGTCLPSSCTDRPRQDCGEPRDRCTNGVDTDCGGCSADPLPMCGDPQRSLREAIANADHDSILKTHIFCDALISGLSFPVLSASTHDTVLEKIRIPAVPPKQTVPPNAQTIQKIWLPSNFRIKIDGLDEPCRKVNKIESIVVPEKSAVGSVNLWNGNFFLCQPVVSLPGDGFPLQFDLFFNGESNADGPFGLKWRNTYQMRLNVNLTDRVGLESANGTLYYYYPRDAGYIAGPGAPGDLTRNPDGTYRIVAYDTHVIYQFDKDGQWTQKFDPVTGATQTIAYRDGNVIVTDGFGRSLTIETKGKYASAVFDNLGTRYVEPQIDANGLLVGLTFGDATLNFNYAAGQMTGIVNPSGMVDLEIRYNGAGAVVDLLQPESFDWKFSTGPSARITAPDGGVWGATHDPSGRLLTTTGPLGATTRLSYTAMNDFFKITNPSGDELVISYNDQREPTSVSFGDRRESLSYDASGNPAEYTNAAGLITQYRRGPDGSTQIVLTNGSLWSYQFGANRRLATETDPTGRVKNYTYGGVDGLGSLRIGSGSLSAQVDYDALGRPLQFTDTSGGATLYNWNQQNLLTGITEASGTPVERVTAYTYDPNGFLVRQSDPRGEVTLFGYNARNLPAVVTQAADTPDERSFIFRWDAYRRKIAETDPRGNETQWTWSSAGGLLKISSPLGVTQFRYDASGRLVGIDRPNGNQTTISRNLYNDITGIRAQSGESVLQSFFTYDILGNRTQMTDNDSEGSRVTTYAYDALNRLTATTTPSGFTSRYAYDGAGRLVRLEYPDSTAVVYSYDAEGRLQSLTDGAGARTAYSYDPAARAVSVALPNGTTVTRKFDPHGLVALVTNGTLSSFQYEYDADGNLVRTVSKAGETLYAYDNLNRRTSWKAPSGNVTTYSYDAAGNRVAVNTPSGSSLYSYDSFNRLTRSGDGTLSYDANGDLIDDGSLQYRYDARGRLVTVSGAANAQYDYDGSGRRISRQTSAGTYTYTFDPLRGRTLTETGPDGNSNFVYGLGRVALIRPSGTLYYLYDGEGNVVEVVDSSGAVIEENAYDPFGVRLTPPAPGSPNKFGYRGAATDPETGLVYIGGRYYWPKQARYLSPPY